MPKPSNVLPEELYTRLRENPSCAEGVEAREIIDNLPIGIFVVEIAGNGRLSCVLSNQAFDRFIGIPAVGVDSEFWTSIEMAGHLKDCAAQGKAITFEWIQEREIDQACFECQAIPLTENATDGAFRILGTATDQTKQRRAEQHFLQQAMHDSLTSLPNRALFEELLEQAERRRANDPSHQFAVMRLNVDRMQSINDSLGHLAGDELLVTLARRLQQCLRTQDVAARISGDEFGILLSGYGDEAEVVQVAETIHKSLEHPVKLSGAEVYTSVGIGIATSDNREAAAEDMARDADIAMHRAKASGRGRSEVFDKERHHQTRSQLHLEAHLRTALDNAEFLLHYQPIISLETGKLREVEALMRWQHPQHGFLSPGTFIPLAEETGMIVPLGTWAIEEACRQLQVWRRDYPDTAPETVAINVSGVQMMREEFVEETLETIRRHDLDPGSVKIEITESAVMENPETAERILMRLKENGFPLAVDDFGTGYSSLAYLQKFSFDVLKIDRSFIAQLSENPDNDKIVKIIAALAQTLDLLVVAEGIETKEQLVHVKAVGCHYGQGFYFSRPQSAADIEAMLHDSPSFV